MLLWQELQKVKSFRVFMWFYNIGVPLTAVMMLVRGVTQVLGLSLSSALSASISGIAGIGHIFDRSGNCFIIDFVKEDSIRGNNICILYLLRNLRPAVLNSEPINSIIIRVHENL